MVSTYSPSSALPSIDPYVFVVRIYDISKSDENALNQIESELEFVNEGVTSEHSSLRELMHRIGELIRRPSSPETDVMMN